MCEDTYCISLNYAVIRTELESFWHPYSQQNPTEWKAQELLGVSIQFVSQHVPHIPNRLAG